MSARLTPVMQQHAEAKRAHPDAIVFFRLGDFYEMFGDDAVVAAPLLELTLTSRNKGKADEIPLAGLPHHAAAGYIARLLSLGHKVAICEQMADPAKCKGIVPRQVVRVITPGLVTEREHLDASANNFLAALEVTPSAVGVSLFDFSTGELLSAELPDVPSALAELSRARPREILVGFESEALRPGVIEAVTALGRAALREDAAARRGRDRAGFGGARRGCCAAALVRAARGGPRAALCSRLQPGGRAAGATHCPLGTGHAARDRPRSARSFGVGRVGLGPARGHLARCARRHVHSRWVLACYGDDYWLP